MPTAAEAGYDELTFIGGAGLFGWKGMPEALRGRISDNVNAVLADPAVQQKLTAAGQQAIGGGPERLSALIADQRKRVLEMAQTIDLRAAR